MCPREPKYQLYNNKDMAVGRTAALGDMFLHYEEFGHVVLFGNGSKDQ